jgi:ADP-ribosylglycohydrolase
MVPMRAAARMTASLDGLSVGDALGAQFFMVGRSIPDLMSDRPPAAPWEWTDDTEMACGLVANYRRTAQSTRTGWRPASPTGASPTAVTGLGPW